MFQIQHFVFLSSSTYVFSVSDRLGGQVSDQIVMGTLDKVKMQIKLF